MGVGGGGWRRCHPNSAQEIWKPLLGVLGQWLVVQRDRGRQCCSCPVVLGGSPGCPGIAEDFQGCKWHCLENHVAPRTESGWVACKVCVSIPARSLGPLPFFSLNTAQDQCYSTLLPPARPTDTRPREVSRDSSAYGTKQEDTEDLTSCWPFLGVPLQHVSQQLDRFTAGVRNQGL